MSSNTDYETLNLVIPEKHRPGTDLMSKAMIKDERIMNVVLSALIGEHSNKNYTAHDGEWLDGKRVDLLFVPAQGVSESSPPVVVEIQNVVDKPFLYRLHANCNHVYQSYSVELIALTVCIRSARAEVCDKFTDCAEGKFLKKLPSDYCAKKHVIMTPATIAEYLVEFDKNSNSNLHPLAALGYVLTEQKCSMFGLRHKEDPTVVLLYKVAKEALSHSIWNHESTVDLLVSTATETQRQFKRILEAANDEEPDLKKIKNLASDGVLYTEKCLQNYHVQDREESDLMPEPLPLPPTVQPSASSKHVEVLREPTPTLCLSDLQYANTFKEEYLKTHKRMNWKRCYEKGLTEGYFKTYKSHQTLKNTYNYSIKK